MREDGNRRARRDRTKISVARKVNKRGTPIQRGEEESIEVSRR